MKRRTFLKTSITASAIAGLPAATLRLSAAEGATAGREYYELRTYRLKAGAKRDLLDSYLESALIPALGRLGVKPVGVFNELEPKEVSGVRVLIPHSSLESAASASLKINADPEFQKSGANYLHALKAEPAFDRIDSWLLLAFAGMPKLELPEYSREKKARIFELRTYESHSEEKALKKVEMFNSGEIPVMKEVGLGPIFFGQALFGRDLPHLTYMLSGEDRDAHKRHWGGFGSNAVWNKLKNDPQYADTVSKITNVFLGPTAYSQI